MTLTEVFSSIANAIRSKTGKTATIKPVNMAAEIESISSGGGGNTLQEVVDNQGGDGKPSCNYLFYQYKGTSLDNVIKTLDFSKVTSMSGMFKSCYNLASIPQLDTSKITTMYEMFASCQKLTTLPEMDASNVTNMDSMFMNCSELTEVSLLNSIKVTSMSQMFYGCIKLQTIHNLDTRKVSSLRYAFRNCGELISMPELDLNNCTSLDSTFSSCNKITEIRLLNTSNVTNMQSTFYMCDNLISISALDTNKATDMSGAFRYCSLLKKIDITKLVSGTSYNSNFAGSCYSLKTLIIRTMDTIPTLNSNAFTDCYHFYGKTNSIYNPEGLKDGAIYVPDNKVESLKTATNWSVFADIIKPLSTYVEV